MLTRSQKIEKLRAAYRIGLSAIARLLEFIADGALCCSRARSGDGQAISLAAAGNRRFGRTLRRVMKRAVVRRRTRRTSAILANYGRPRFSGVTLASRDIRRDMRASITR